MLSYLLSGLSMLLMIGTLLPFLNSKQWWIRDFDFPRLQIFILSLVTLILFTLTQSLNHWTAYSAFIILILIILYQGSKIFPYTIFFSKQVQNSAPNEKTFSLITANVLKCNKQAKQCIAMIKQQKPDIILLIEVDHWWVSQLEEVFSVYPYKLLHPLENTYGMLLLSQMELVQPEVKFLISSEVPSIHAHVNPTQGPCFKLICLHPVPPTPPPTDGGNSDSKERDIELLKVARMVAETDDPTIVLGDLNDVAWSKTTDEFQTISGLLDPRRGRGMFNSFHAKYFFLRFPLDHVFSSNHFHCKALKRLESIGSDHFPIYVEFSLEQ
ncbi:endonuclease/exonuclease/phosphatase family protein [Legionella yabuuchiae]|uniref:endonuclease/exonuclease/phosphatase family protein n=1 Tax=Legionella yabuuchiae TaxID=376727 RepID=UPI00105693D7|nr:endonuclease/exonuclease/phosphatase family protein [Legionella yabuuchiae]